MQDELRPPVLVQDASQSLFVLPDWVASAVVDQPGRPRVKMIFLLWASWALAMVAYLGVVWAR